MVNFETRYIPGAFVRWLSIVRGFSSAPGLFPGFFTKRPGARCSEKEEMKFENFIYQFEIQICVLIKIEKSLPFDTSFLYFLQHLGRVLIQSKRVAARR